MLFLLGCLDRLLEGPLILTSGLGEVRSLAITRDHLLVATDQGLFSIDGQGGAERTREGNILAVTTHPRTQYILVEGKLLGSGEWQGEIAVPEAVDIQAGYQGEVAVLYQDGMIEQVFPAEQRRVAWGKVAGASRLALCPEEQLCVVTPDALWMGGLPQTARRVERWDRLVGVATDARGRMFAVGADQGPDLHLFRLDAQQHTLAARFLDSTLDLHFGPGGMLPAENLFLAGGKSGQVLYVRPL